MAAHLLDMSSYTIASPMTTWAELRTTDHATDSHHPAVRIGRRVLIPRRPSLAAFGIVTPVVTRDQVAPP